MKIKAVLIIFLMLFSVIPMFPASYAAQTYGDDFEDGTLDWWDIWSYGGITPTITSYSYNGDYAANLTTVEGIGYSGINKNITSNNIQVNFMFNIQSSETTSYYLFKLINGGRYGDQPVSLSYAGGGWGGMFILYAGSDWEMSPPDYGELDVWYNVTVHAWILGSHQYASVIVNDELILEADSVIAFNFYESFSLHCSRAQINVGSACFLFDDVFYGPPDEEIPEAGVQTHPYVYSMYNDTAEEYQLWFTRGEGYNYLVASNSEGIFYRLLSAPHRSLGLDSLGNYHLVWDEQEDYCMYSNSTDGGVTWSTPLLVEFEPEWNFYPMDMAVSPSGVVHIIGYETEYEYLTYVQITGGVVDSYVLWNEDYSEGKADLCVDEEGGVHVAVTRYYDEEYYVDYMTVSLSGFDDWVEIADDYVDSTLICIEPYEEIYAVQYQNGDNGDFHCWFGDSEGFGDEATMPYDGNFWFSMVSVEDIIHTTYFGDIETSEEYYYYVQVTQDEGYIEPELVVDGAEYEYLRSDYPIYTFDQVYDYNQSKPNLIWIETIDEGEGANHYVATRNSWENNQTQTTEYLWFISALYNPFGYDYLESEEPTPTELEDYGIANMEGCGNWVFEGNTKYLFYTTSSTATPTDLKVGLAFTDAANRWFTMLYNTETLTFSKSTPENAVSISLKDVNLGADEVYVSWEVMFHNQIADSLNVTLYTFIGAADDAVFWNATAPDYFNIYNIGGFASYQSSGDAGKITGGDIFELYTHDNSSWAYSEAIYKYLQHIHFLVSWDLGNITGFIGEDPYLLCPSDYDPYTGTLAYGLYVCYNDLWINELTVVLDVADGFVMMGDDNWVKIRVRWYHLNELIKTDHIYSYDFGWIPDGAVWGQDTSIKLWVDLWFNKVNASTTMGGRVGSYMIGVKKEGWWIWSDYHPLYSESSFDMCFTDLTDEEENVFSCKELKMMKTYCNLTQTDNDWGWEVRDYTVFTHKFAYASMEGIETPSSEFQPAQDPTLPVGGLLGGLNAAFQTLAKSISYALTFGALSFAGYFAESIDFLAGLFGVTNFTDMLIGSISSMTAYVAQASEWMTSLFVYTFSFLTSFFYWLWLALDNTLFRWGAMWGTLTEILGGTFEGTVNLWEYFGVGDFLLLFIIIAPFLYFESVVNSRSPLRMVWGDLQAVTGFFSTVINFLSDVVSLIIDAVHAAIEAIPVVE